MHECTDTLEDGTCATVEGLIRDASDPEAELQAGCGLLAHEHPVYRDGTVYGAFKGCQLTCLTLLTEFNQPARHLHCSADAIEGSEISCSCTQGY